MKIVHGVFPAILVSLLTTGCTTHKPKAIPQNTASLSSTQVVQYYYASLSAHDVTDAQRFMSPKLIAFYRSSKYGLKNIKNISHLQLSSPKPVTSKTGVEVEIIATFDAQYYHAGGATDGPQTIFIYVRKAAENQPWHIQSVGSGP